jgi:long-chain acyl-CoA synthetase
VMGYWGLPQASDAAFGEGWYRTGDVVVRDEEGFLFVKDRLKDMLIRGGENIYCGEIEDALASHEAVAECAVFGMPDHVLGEVVAAAIVLRAGYRADGTTLRAHAAERLAAHKVPVVIDIREGALPRNPAGKVLKTELRTALIACPSPAGSNGTSA